MRTQTPEIDTYAAMRIANANGAVWRLAMGKGLIPNAPPVVSPSKRLWDADALLALRWFDSLVKAGMPVPLAGALGGELTKAMISHPEIPVFFLFSWPNADGRRGHAAVGTEPPDEAPNARVVADLPVQRWRTEIRAAIARHFQRKAERHVRTR